MNEEEKKSVNELKEEINKPVEVQGDKFDTFILYNIESAQTILNLIEKLQKENEELKEDLKYVLNQTLGAFEKNWCIDWNFTEIREKYNLESEE